MGHRGQVIVLVYDAITSSKCTVANVLFVCYFSEEDVVNFFPISRMKDSRQHQELTDTFSIEEMSVSGGEEEEEDLHLVPPTPVYKRFGCCGVPTDKCSLM